jgi:hypothetical protein
MEEGIADINPGTGFLQGLREYYPSGFPCLLHRLARAADPGIFPKKTGSGNPLRKAGYLQPIDTFFWPKMPRMTNSSTPFSSPKEDR